MRDVLRSAQRYWLIGFTIACFILAAVYLEKITDQLREPIAWHTPYLLAALALQAAFWAILTLCWQRVVQTFVAKSLPVRAAFVQLTLVNLGKYLPGKLWGMLARGNYMNRQGMRLNVVLAATLYEQLQLLHSGLVVGALSAAITFGPRYGALLVLVALLSVLLGLRFRNALLRGLNHIARRLDRTATASSTSNVGATDYAALLGYYALLWILSGLILVSLYTALFDRVLEPALLAALVLANTISIVGGFAAIFAPAGIGVREITLVALLAPVMGMAEAVLLSVISRLWLVAMDLAGGALALVLRPRMHRERPHPL